MATNAGETKPVGRKLNNTEIIPRALSYFEQFYDLKNQSRHGLVYIILCFLVSLASAHCSLCNWFIFYWLKQNSRLLIITFYLLYDPQLIFCLVSCVVLSGEILWPLLCREIVDLIQCINHFYTCSFIQGKSSACWHLFHCHRFSGLFESALSWTIFID